MPKVNDIASTAHAQHAEMQALTGAVVPKSTELDEAHAEIEALTGKLAGLQADFDALKASNDALVKEHEAMQAAMNDAPPAEESK